MAKEDLFRICMNIALKVICARGLSTGKFRRRGFSEVQYAMLTCVSKPHKK